MPIGDYGNSNGSGSRKPTDYSYYLRGTYSFKNNEEGKVFGAQYSGGLLSFTIKDMNNHFDELAKVSISPMKARLLSDQLGRFLEYRAGKSVNESEGFGISTGLGEVRSFIVFSADAAKRCYVTIGKFDNNGVITESVKFAFNVDYHEYIKWNNIENNDITVDYDNDLEINVIKEMLTDFSRNMNGAAAYASFDLGRWDRDRNDSKMNQVFDRLGIDRPQQRVSYSSSQKTNNFLANAGRSSSTSVEDIEDLLN